MKYIDGNRSLGPARKLGFQILWRGVVTPLPWIGAYFISGWFEGHRQIAGSVITAVLGVGVTLAFLLLSYTKHFHRRFAPLALTCLIALAIPFLIWGKGLLGPLEGNYWDLFRMYCSFSLILLSACWLLKLGGDRLTALEVSTPVSWWKRAVRILWMLVLIVMWMVWLLTPASNFWFVGKLTDGHIKVWEGAGAIEGLLGAAIFSFYYVLLLMCSGHLRRAFDSSRSFSQRVVLFLQYALGYELAWVLVVYEWVTTSPPRWGFPIWGVTEGLVGSAVWLGVFRGADLFFQSRLVKESVLSFYRFLLRHKRVTVFTVGLTVLYIGGSIAAQRILYQPPNSSAQVIKPAEMTSMTLLREGLGDLKGVFVWMTREQSPTSVAVVYCSGNGENLGALAESGLFGKFTRRGINLFAFEYPGYGKSEGIATEGTLRDAALSVIDYIHWRWPNRPIVLCGRSLGAAVVLEAATAGTYAVQGLVLISPWTSLRDVAAVHYPRWLVRGLLWEQYDSLKSATLFHGSVLVIHGTSDQIIPFEQGQALSVRFQPKAQLIAVNGAGHNDILNFEETWNGLDTFLNAVSR